MHCFFSYAFVLLGFSKIMRRALRPKGPSQELISAIIEMKRRNPRFGCRRLAMQISNAFGCEIDKDVVRRILSKYLKLSPAGGGPSWLTFIGHVKDSLWSIDFSRAESIHLKSHWIMVIMRWTQLARQL
jgi:putative transposase